MSLPYKTDLIPRAKELRKQATPQENHLWYDFLRSYPVRFQRQKTIDSFIADFYCHKAKLVVEIDGWRHFTEDGLDYDEKRTAYFETRGLKVVRYRGAAVDADIEAVARQIEEMARTRIAELER